MNETATKIDALLATATSRLLASATAANELRRASFANDVPAGLVATNALCDHMAVVEASFREVNRLARAYAETDLISRGMLMMMPKGGLVH
ncbi:MAG TPA: hypothetical protein VGG26_09035 [Terracidiphilus sp.]|jgi:hypothetical protein